MMSDFKEARDQVSADGFAWGIRQAIWGKPEKSTQQRQQELETKVVESANKIKDVDGKDKA